MRRRVRTRSGVWWREEARLDLSSRVALPAAVGSFFVLAFVMPNVRLRIRTGTWAVVVHRGEPVHRFLGAALVVALVAVGAGAALYGAMGPERFGVWSVPAWVTIAGWALMAMGFAVVVIAQAQMGSSFRIGIDDRPTALVTGGVFRVVRHPIYAALLVTLAGAVLVAPCAWTAMLWPEVLVLVGLQARLEEQHLERLHGDVYRAWASRVGRFVPGVGRIGGPP